MTGSELVLVVVSISRTYFKRAKLFASWLLMKKENTMETTGMSKWQDSLDERRTKYEHTVPW